MVLKLKTYISIFKEFTKKNKFKKTGLVKNKQPFYVDHTPCALSMLYTPIHILKLTLEPNLQREKLVLG